MVELRAKIEAEFENIQRALTEIPSAKRLSKLSALELAGAAALLHGVYTGMENVIKQALVSGKSSLPSGQSWHRDLLVLALKEGIISVKTREALLPYLAFRHFFSHAYAMDLDSVQLNPLVANVHDVFSAFKTDMEMALKSKRSSRNA